MATITLEKFGNTNPWIARIVGTSDRYGFARQFEKGTPDYSKSNSTGSRGIFYTFEMADGDYEVCGGWSWRYANQRRFIRVSGDKQEQVSADDVLRTLQEQKRKELQK